MSAAGTIGAAIAAEAPTWVGTPFHWQARLKGVGCDCKGLVAGVAAACGRPEAATVEALAGDYRDGRFSPARLRAGLERLFDRVEQATPGDVLLLIVGGKPQHLAICTQAEAGRPIRLVHAYPGIAKVTEAKIGSAHRIAAIYRWRDLDDAS